MTTTSPATKNIQLPADLLQAISAEGGGRVVIVIGAGASFEEPTEIPLARECSEDAHRKLVDDGVLVQGDCDDPSDLSELAEVVHTKTGGQRALVERLPRSRFRMAPPNVGSTIAAALLREGAVSAVLSLNFDLSLQRALAELGETNHVALIRGPDDQVDIGNVNFIYLHRSVEADPEEWVLRSKDLETSWRDGWEEMMAGRVITAASAVFAGLGAPAAVLVETAKKIRSASKNNARAFQVDPMPQAKSAFADALEIGADDYLQYGWCEFMVALSERLLLVHIDELKDACAAIVDREEWNDSTPDDLRERLGSLGLVGLGRVRASWTLEKIAYLPRTKLNADLIADLLLGVGLIEQATGYLAVFADDGVVDFVDGENLVGSLILGSGRGTMRWGTVEATLYQRQARKGVAARRPSTALVGSISDQRPQAIAPPLDVLRGEVPPESILSTGGPLRLVTVDELRSNPALAKEIIGD